MDQILAAMHWLGLDYDEGPIYQMQRLDHYRAVVDQMLGEGSAYRCYCTPEELEDMREAQRARGEKTRYDGRWRPEPGKTLPPVPEGVQPVVRFKSPIGGAVSWDDKVKGRIEFSNDELDDLVIARPDGTPTYNFCVVVDDIDMRITHVIRGDDHVNNTPRQIHILRALGHEPPVYAHLPTVLNEQGEKMSKRHGAKPVTQYRDEGYLPEAVVNYLARLGWSHGDEELFTRAQLVEWFDGSHLSKSPAQWDVAKLNWVNAQTLKQTADATLAPLVAEQLARREITVSVDERLARMCALFKDRCHTTAELAEWLSMYFVEPASGDNAEQLAAVNAVPRGALLALADKLTDVEWDKARIAAAVKDVLAECRLKMGQFAPAVRVLVCGRPQTPSLDAVLELFQRETVLVRLRRGLPAGYNRGLA